MRPGFWYLILRAVLLLAVVESLRLILRYVRGTLHYDLTYTKGQPGFVGYTNADWSGAIDGQQLTGACFFILKRGSIS